MKFEKEDFYFEVFTIDAVANAIKNLPTGKVSVSNDIPVSIMKETKYCPKLTQIMNECLFIFNLFIVDKFYFTVQSD